MKYLLSLMFILSIGSQIYSQDLTFYPFRGVVSLSSSQDNRIWIDQRLHVNTFMGNADLETHLDFCLWKKDWISFYAGGGLSYNVVKVFFDLPLLNGYLITGGVRFVPFEKRKEFHINFELQTYITRHFDGGQFNGNLGIGYNF